TGPHATRWAPSGVEVNAASSRRSPITRCALWCSWLPIPSGIRALSSFTSGRRIGHNSRRTARAHAMKGRPAVFALAIGGWMAAALATVQTSAPQDVGADRKAGPYQATEIKAVLDKYCVTCHSERLHTAGLVLEGIDVANPAAHADVWERVLTKLHARS